MLRIGARLRAEKKIVFRSLLHMMMNDHDDDDDDDDEVVTRSAAPGATATRRSE